MTVHDIVTRLEAHGSRVRSRQGGRFAADCPAHDDSKLHLAVKAADRVDGVLVHCHKGCQTGAVCASLGLEKSALFAFSLRRLCSSSGTGGKGTTTKYLPVVSLLENHRLGLLDPVAVELVLPRRTGRVQRAVAADMELLFGLRFATGDRRPLPYAEEWAGARLGEDHRNVGRALRSLVDHGTIRPFGKLPSSRGRGGTQKYALVG